MTFHPDFLAALAADRQREAVADARARAAVGRSARRRRRPLPVVRILAAALARRPATEVLVRR
jgi:hypothetical protein